MHRRSDKKEKRGKIRDFYASVVGGGKREEDHDKPWHFFLLNLLHQEGKGGGFIAFRTLKGASSSGKLHPGRRGRGKRKSRQLSARQASAYRKKKEGNVHKIPGSPNPTGGKKGGGLLCGGCVCLVRRGNFSLPAKRKKREKKTMRRASFLRFSGLRLPRAARGKKGKVSRCLLQASCASWAAARKEGRKKKGKVCRTVKFLSLAPPLASRNKGRRPREMICAIRAVAVKEEKGEEKEEPRRSSVRSLFRNHSKGEEKGRGGGKKGSELPLP